MHIEKKYCCNTLPAFTAISRETTAARQHASLFPTQMALTRWTRGGDIPHVHTSERNMPMRSAWYAEAQQRFQSWLDAGGFHRADDDNLDCALHEAGMTPAGIDGGHADDDRATAPFPVPGIGSWPMPDRKK